LSVVIDASALVVLALDRRRAPGVEARLRAWEDAGEPLHAPELLRYEIANALARAVAVDQLPALEATAAWELVTSVPVMLHRLEEGPAVIAMTQRLERKSAYDAAYLVLADRLGVELWTLDGPLARNAASRDLPVRLIEACSDQTFVKRTATDQGLAERTGTLVRGEEPHRERRSRTRREQVARCDRAHNPKVAGSNPAPATLRNPRKCGGFGASWNVFPSES
jgi:predicted nucleic acid-binding protein